MPTYRFITRNGEAHEMAMELPNDEAAKKEARRAFAEAVSDAALDSEKLDIMMRLERDGLTLYSAEMHLTSNDGDA